MAASSTAHHAPYDELIDDLAYSYDGVFSRQTRRRRRLRSHEPASSPPRR